MGGRRGLGLGPGPAGPSGTGRTRHSSGERGPGVALGSSSAWQHRALRGGVRADSVDSADRGPPRGGQRKGAGQSSAGAPGQPR